jgi:hypothetical protein
MIHIAAISWNLPALVLSQHPFKPVLKTGVLVVRPRQFCHRLIMLLNRKTLNITVATQLIQSTPTILAQEFGGFSIALAWSWLPKADLRF